MEQPYSGNAAGCNMKYNQILKLLLIVAGRIVVTSVNCRERKVPVYM